METICANFLWGEADYGGKYHWVSWKKCCSPINKGGLGIRGIQDTVSAFSMKLWWQFQTGSSLWVQFMKSKYCFNVYPSDCVRKAGSSSGLAAIA